MNIVTMSTKKTIGNKRTIWKDDGINCGQAEVISCTSSEDNNEQLYKAVVDIIKEKMLLHIDKKDMEQLMIMQNAFKYIIDNLFQNVEKTGIDKFDMWIEKMASVMQSIPASSYRFHMGMIGSELEQWQLKKEPSTLTTSKITSFLGWDQVIIATNMIRTVADELGVRWDGLRLIPERLHNDQYRIRYVCQCMNAQHVAARREYNSLFAIPNLQEMLVWRMGLRECRLRGELQSPQRSIPTAKVSTDVVLVDYVDNLRTFSPLMGYGRVERHRVSTKHGGKIQIDMKQKDIALVDTEKCQMVYIPYDKLSKFGYTAISHSWGRWLAGWERADVDGCLHRIPILYEEVEGHHGNEILKQVKNVSRFIWLDWYCLDQEDRQAQVQDVALQTDIFKSAQKVVVYQHEQSPGSLYEYLSTSIQDDCEEICLDVKNSLLEMARNDAWCQSHWTVQEVTVSTQPIMLIHNKLFRWSVIKNAIIECIEKLEPRNKQKLPKGLYYKLFKCKNNSYALEEIFENSQLQHLSQLGIGEGLLKHGCWLQSAEVWQLQRQLQAVCTFTSDYTPLLNMTVQSQHYGCMWPSAIASSNYKWNAEESEIIIYSEHLGHIVEPLVVVGVNDNYTTLFGDSMINVEVKVLLGTVTDTDSKKGNENKSNVIIGLSWNGKTWHMETLELHDYVTISAMMGYRITGKIMHVGATPNSFPMELYSFE